MRKCRECKGNLIIIGLEEDLIIVECKDCGESYVIEPDGFGEGGLEWVEAQMMKEDKLIE